MMVTHVFSLSSVWTKSNYNCHSDPLTGGEESADHTNIGLTGFSLRSN